MKGILKAPFGIVGLETAAPDLYTSGKTGTSYCDADGGKMSYHPARILGLNKGVIEEGAPADLVIFDPDREWVIDPSEFLSKGKNTPFAGKKFSER